MKYRILFITVLLILTSVQIFAQVDKRGIEIDSCICTVTSSDLFIKHLPVDSTNYFTINCNCDLVKYKLFLYNRWGNEVYSTSDIKVESLFAEVKPGSYFWLIKSKYPKVMKAEFKGKITIE